MSFHNRLFLSVCEALYVVCSAITPALSFRTDHVQSLIVRRSHSSNHAITNADRRLVPFMPRHTLQFPGKLLHVFNRSIWIKNLSARKFEEDRKIDNFLNDMLIYGFQEPL